MAANGTASAAARPPRTRAPRYHVLELRELKEPAFSVSEAREGATSGRKFMAWVVIAEDVAAPSDREAIDKALDTIGRTGEARLGEYWVPLASQFRIRTKKAETRTEEVWT